MLKPWCWLVYNPVIPEGWELNQYGALTEPGGSVKAYYSRSRERGVDFNEIAERHIIPPPGNTGDNGQWHGALDLRYRDNDERHEIYACLDGEVTYVGEPAPPGGCIVIRSQIGDLPLWILYQHVQPIVRFGEVVPAGHKIGFTDSTAKHIHSEVYSTGVLWSRKWLKRPDALAYYFKYSPVIEPRAQWKDGVVLKKAGIARPREVYIYNLLALLDDLHSNADVI
jgi:murein DD-endopeptidase MepM/ murein hydrolase activator NlpD